MLVVPMPPQPSHLLPPSDTPSTTPTTPGNTPPKIASRPKLTLQTSSLPRTFGRSSTGLSVSLATASPTINNTFKNAYEPCPPSAIPAAAATTTTSNQQPPSTSSPAKFPSQKYSYPSFNSGNPYQQPLGVKSILRNSPLEHKSHRRSVSVNGANGASGSRRVLFPTKKQVSYRQPLEEEIQTMHYVARHSDLIAEEMASGSRDRNQKKEQTKEGSPLSDSESNSSLAPSDSSGSDDDHTGSTTTSLSKCERKKRKSLSAERQVRAVALLDGLESDSYDASTPQTPCQSRVKRRREWRWTLGPRNESCDLPGTPEDVESLAPVTATTTSSSSSSTIITPSKSRKHAHPENDDETESLGSCESDWSSTSLGSSAASAHITNPSDESKMHDS